MKKLSVLLTVLLCVFSLAACSASRIDTKTPVFDTASIRRIVFFPGENRDNQTEVPEENREEIAQWLSTFRVCKKADALHYGLFVRIEYMDGSAVEKSLGTVMIGEDIYELEHGSAPQCFFEITK